jgi:hypothetical protein
MADAVAFRRRALHEGRQVVGVAADDEKGRARAFLRQRVQHMSGRSRRPVVECQHDLMVTQIQRARIALQADRRPLGAADFDGARNPERLWAAILPRGGGR